MEGEVEVLNREGKRLKPERNAENFLSPKNIFVKSMTTFPSWGQYCPENILDFACCRKRISGASNFLRHDTQLGSLVQDWSTCLYVSELCAVCNGKLPHPTLPVFEHNECYKKYVPYVQKMVESIQIRLSVN